MKKIEKVNINDNFYGTESRILGGKLNEVIEAVNHLIEMEVLLGGLLETLEEKMPDIEKAINITNTLIEFAEKERKVKKEV